jgi:hypothetical protein
MKKIIAGIFLSVFMSAAALGQNTLTLTGAGGKRSAGGGGTLLIDSEMPKTAGVGLAQYATAQASPLSFSFTNAAGNVLYLGVALNTDVTGVTVSVTYNSVAMTQLGAISPDANSLNTGAIYLFRLSNPATSANTLSISWTGGGTATVEAAAISLSSANATPDTGSATTAQDTGDFSSSAFTVTVPSTTNGNSVIQAACFGDPSYASVSGTLSANTATNADGGAFCNNFAFQYDSTTGGSKAMTINGTTGTSWATLGIEVKH